METNGKYYLGKIFNVDSGKVSDEPLLYDGDDLTTHAVVVGMTGSGKTGLCIDLLEEAALLNIPALMIDPKGDITNTLLHFPDLLPADFQPWVNADQARRDGKTMEQASAEAAANWQAGLANWGIDSQRLLNLKNAAHFAVYTPGSDAGIPVSILASLKAPPIPWESNRELLREKISGTVTALLGLVGLTDIDPVRSREHILLSNIFEAAWSQGRDLNLSELILQTQTPPFEKLGVFDVNTFFPEKDRFELAMLLNNIMAAPAFQTWIEGQPLDVASLLYHPDGRPRHSVFYIAHLTDAERMFFVTLLYSAVESWMRSQPGTNSLRAIVYFDEIFGYLPPISNPPSKEPMLRMLKQARAFGVGQVLVTQNPVDVDYKALSNAGTWMIGKLQTEQDKQRLLDGLQGAQGGALDRSEYDRMISGLGKRVFLLHNVHEKHPLLFQTRWAMNYLAGPLTRTQIPALNQLAGAGLGGQPAGPAAPAPVSTPGQGLQAAPAAGAVPQPQTATQPDPALGGSVTHPTLGGSVTHPTLGGSVTRPTLPSGIAEYFLPNNLTFTQAMKSTGRAVSQDAQAVGLLYRPVLLAQASVRFFNRKYNLDYEMNTSVMVDSPDRRGVVRWEEHQFAAVDPRGLDRQPDPSAHFVAPEAPLTESRTMKSLESDFQDWVYRSVQVTVRANESLDIYAGPDISAAEFRTMCAEAARKERDEEVQKVSDKYDKKIATLQERMAREERELAEDETELSQRKMEELGTHAENIFGFFSKKSRSTRRISSSLSKRRMTEQAKADVDESIDAIADFKKQIGALEKEKQSELEDVNDRWGEIANQSTDIPVTPYKKDILVDLFGVAWMPFHVVQTGNQAIELPGYGSE